MRLHSRRHPDPRVRALACVLAIAVGVGPTSAHASIAEEKKVGDEVVKEVRRGLPLITDWEINDLVTSTGRKLVGVLGTQPFEYEFFVVSEDSINAFAVPGGKIFVHAGLISRAESEDELAGVMAHEVGHAHAHHAVRQEEKGAAANYAALLGIFLTALNPVLGQAAIAAAMSQQLKYQRDFEREADFLGIGYAKKAGYEPGAMFQLLSKIYDEQKINPTMMPPYFQSHPLTGERMAYLEAALKQNEWQAKKVQKSWRLERAQAIADANAKTRRDAVTPYERRLATASAADKPGALELIGLLMVHGEEYDNGRKYLQQAEAAGRNVDRELGRAELRLGRLDEAKPRLERRVSAQPADYNALADLGELYFQQGKFQDAVLKLTRAVELYPYSPAMQRTFARALDKDGRTGAGFFHFGAASELEGDVLGAIGYYQKALTLLEEKDPLRTKAKDRIDELEKERPRLPFGPPGGRRVAE
jgi:predicted Zn-dependent protease